MADVCEPTPQDSHARDRVPWVRETPPMVLGTPRSVRSLFFCTSRSFSFRPEQLMSEDAPLAVNLAVMRSYGQRAVVETVPPETTTVPVKRTLMVDRMSAFFSSMGSVVCPV